MSPLGFDDILQSPLRLLSLNPEQNTEASSGVKASASSFSDSNSPVNGPNLAFSYAAQAEDGRQLLIAAVSSEAQGTAQEVIYIPGKPSGEREASVTAPSPTPGSSENSGSNISVSSSFNFFSRENSTGQILGWQLDAGLNASSEPLNAQIPDTSWQLEVTGDFNGDGQADILVQQDEGFGGSIIWHLDRQGKRIISDVTVQRQFTDSNLNIVGSLQVDDDAKAEILLHNSAANQAIAWSLDGSGAVVAELPVGRTLDDPSWKFIATADFDGDGSNDILLSHSTSRQMLVWQMDGVNIESEYLLNQILDTGYQIRGARDLNGDSQADLLLYRADTSAYSAWFVQGTDIQRETMVKGLPGGGSQLIL